MLKEESSSSCSKDRYEYEERTNQVTGNKEIEHRILATNFLRAVAC